MVGRKRSNFTVLFCFYIDVSKCENITLKRKNYVTIINRKDCLGLTNGGENMIVVSACLAGMNVRYNGSNSLDERIQKLLLENQAMTVCPELLGGFTTPREPAEIVGGDGEDVLDGKAKVIEKSGKDVTKQYINGAYAALKKAQELGADTIILKENSPSCGSSVIYNGEFKGVQIVGNGVTTALLRKNGFKVISENNFNEYSILEIN